MLRKIGLGLIAVGFCWNAQADIRLFAKVAEVDSISGIGQWEEIACFEGINHAFRVRIMAENDLKLQEESLRATTSVMCILDPKRALIKHESAEFEEVRAPLGNKALMGELVRIPACAAYARDAAQNGWFGGGGGTNCHPFHLRSATVEELAVTTEMKLLR